MTEPSLSDVNPTPPQPRTGLPPAMPLWVKVSLVLAGVVGVGLLAVVATGGGGGVGGHGPGMHGGLGATDPPEAPTAVRVR